MKIEYLLFNIVVLSGPVMAGVLGGKRVKLPHWRSALISLGIAATVFIVWDLLVTGLFWFFNPRYVLGFYLGSIPLEEALFFITVPFSCLVLWVNINKVKIIPGTYETEKPMLLILLVFAFAFFIAQRIYTGSVLLAFAGVIFLDTIGKTGLFKTRKFLFYIFCIVNLFTFIFNLYLTARPIVTYNALLKTNIQLITIPIEDFIYGMALVGLVIVLYEMARSTNRHS